MDVAPFQILSDLGSPLAHPRKNRRVTAGGDRSDTSLDPFRMGGALRRHHGIDPGVVGDQRKKILRPQSPQRRNRRLLRFLNLPPRHRPRTIQHNRQINGRTLVRARCLRGIQRNLHNRLLPLPGIDHIAIHLHPAHHLLRSHTRNHRSCNYPSAYH